MQAHFATSPFKIVICAGEVLSIAPEFNASNHLAFPTINIEAESRTEGDVR